ncbi:MAG: hypothetical protein PWQ59_1435 [Thermoanaerobacterium sp.]|jgi:hypothetical protein|nr:hypothetical protein [Thermoanaerobacterium sp.]
MSDSDRNDYKEISKILQIIVFGEASICPDEEKAMIADVFLNELSYPAFMFDRTGGKEGKADPRGIAKNFDAWNKPNIHLTKAYDVEKFIQCGLIADRELEKYIAGERDLSDKAVFYITKKRLSELEAAGKTPQDIFTKYYKVIEIPVAENFYHRFFKIGGEL